MLPLLSIVPEPVAGMPGAEKVTAPLAIVTSTAVLLGIAVAIGETAPLLFTVFGANNTNWNLFHGPQASLPLLIYTSVKSSQNSSVALGYTAALVLFLLVFTLFILARILGSPWLGRTVRARSNRRMADAAMYGSTGGAPT